MPNELNKYRLHLDDLYDKEETKSNSMDMQTLFGHLSRSNLDFNSAYNRMKEMKQAQYTAGEAKAD